MKRDDPSIDQILRTALPSAPDEQMESALGRVHHRLRADRGGEVVDIDAQRTRRRWPLPAAAAAVLALAVGVAVLWPRGEAALYRVVEPDVWALIDGSRVEMQPATDLAVERADDGLRIRLDRGGIIVNAADQRSGHLYVQTKDVTVAVVGTVFMVNAGDEGSRVAVIEGEVRVQQGAVERTLMRGEDLATNASVNAPPVSEAIAWSRNAPALVALLQQSAVVPPAVIAQNPAAPIDAFEVASVRLRAASPGGGRGGPGGQEPKCYGSVQLDPRRLALTNMMLYRIITLAYGKSCYEYDTSELDLLSGGPRWVRADRYDIEATLPQGTPSYTREQFDPWTWSKREPADAPRLQAMLQALLADRFKLVLRRETREIPGFALSVARGGPRLTPWKEGELATLGAVTGAPNPNGEWRTIIRGNKRAISGLAVQLTTATGRPVVDRTGIMGDFNYHIEFTPFTPTSMTVPRGVPVVAGPTLFTALEDTMGLRLEPAPVPVEHLVIERVERPSEN
jgi:uncharacterized protein (TIGR03435 family)